MEPTKYKISNSPTFNLNHSTETAPVKSMTLLFRVTLTPYLNYILLFFLKKTKQTCSCLFSSWLDSCNMLYAGTINKAKKSSGTCSIYHFRKVISKC